MSSEITATESNVAVTVCTPTFNRASLLPRVYESLQQQSCREFEWVVVDDGSSDGTEVLVDGWRATADFPIQYYWQANQGKHAALNVGIVKAKGELFVILDSDDVFPHYAVERALSLWRSIPPVERKRYMGIGGLCAYRDDPGRLVTCPYPKDGLETTYVEISTRYGVWGDRVEFFVTELLRKVLPYPTFPGERFVPEALLWNRLARDYRMRFFNMVLKLVEYQTDGLTKTSGKVPLLVRNPQGARRYFGEFATLSALMPFHWLLRTYGSYVRFSLHAKTGFGRSVREAPSKALCVAMFPVGVLVWLRDKRRYRLG